MYLQYCEAHWRLRIRKEAISRGKRVSIFQSYPITPLNIILRTLGLTQNIYQRFRMKLNPAGMKTRWAEWFIGLPKNQKLMASPVVDRQYLERLCALGALNRHHGQFH